MRSTSIAILCLGASLLACAAGADDDLPGTSPPNNSDDNASLPMPGGTGFDPPSNGAPSGSSSNGSSTSSSSSSGATSSSSSGASTSSTSSSSSGGSGSTSGSTSSSSGGSTSSSSSSSSSGTSGTAGACGVCDRDWTCNGFTDPWVTQGVTCVNTRTQTALKCNGKFDQGGSVNVGTWSSNATSTSLTLNYPMLGGGTKTYVCTP